MKLVYIVLTILVAVQAENYEFKGGPGSEKLLSDIDVMKQLTACFLDTKPCDELIGGLKRDFLKVIANACGDCSPDQKHLMLVFIRTYSKTLPEDYEQLKMKYDPEGVILPKLLSVIEKV